MTKVQTLSGNSNKIDIAGIYEKRGANLHHTSKSIQLVIGTRKKPTIKKPENYLLLKQGKSFSYVSSLFAVADNTFSIDYAGRYYTATIEDSQAQISLSDSQGAQSPDV